MSLTDLQVPPPDTSTTKTGRPRRIHKCRSCHREFKRSEHCARHERVHTQEKPFACRFCTRRYARKDLVQRHERSIHPVDTAAAPPAGQRRQLDTSDTINVGRPAALANQPPEDAPQASPSGAAIEPANDLASRSSQASGGTFSPTQTRRVDDYFHLGSELDFCIDGAPDMDLDSFQHAPPTSFTAENSSHFQPVIPVNMPDQEALLSPLQQQHQQPGDMIEQQDVSPPQPFDEWANMDLGTGSDFNVFQDLAFMTNVGFSPDNEQTMHQGQPQQTPRPPQLRASGSEHSSVAGKAAERKKSNIQGHPLGFANEHTGNPFANLPLISWDSGVHLPNPRIEDLAYQQMHRDVQSRLKANECSQTPLPSAKDIQRFVTSYINCFHRHLPIIHFASFDLHTTPSPLTFAVCAIGALYRLDRKWSKSLYQLATQMLEANSIPNMLGASLAPSPLWIAQTRTLLAVFGMFGDKPAIAKAMISKLGFFVVDYSARRTALLADTRRDEDLTWEEWTCKESSKRVLCAFFILSDMIAITYGVTPGFSTTHDLIIEMPCEEKLWNASSTEQWASLRDFQVSSPIKTIREAMATLILARKEDSVNSSPLCISAFTTVVLMHAVNVHMWTQLQFTQSFSQDASEVGPDGSLQSVLLSAASTALARCQGALTQGHADDPGSTWSETEGPLMFNCRALLRIAYNRIFTDSAAFNRMALLADNPQEVKQALTVYVFAKQQRSHHHTKAVAKAFEGLLAPVRIGLMLVRKTAAFNWSVEHAVAGWDSALFLTKWIHTVEKSSAVQDPDEGERKILDQVKELLAEVESDYSGDSSLAAAVATTWASLLDDVWVWGITPRMGSVLQELASQFEKDYRSWARVS
ncbi:hypothetical protein BU16DRAFT_16843 [Lophium mytilinum]|uniref:C2H2-type domain-containing protein n=1 Tax=Lophium mytilinum TaxID=390894 RepID=A0A6A6RG01_9PEZI|nr:hypothetical protein BU16DRAFT_16843 [Lophium mytilinum]